MGIVKIVRMKIVINEHSLECDQIYLIDRRISTCS